MLRPILLLLCVVALFIAAVYLVSPWLAARLLPAVAAEYGVQVTELVVHRPGLGGIDVVALEASSGGLRLKASDGRVSYQLSDLISGELQQLTLARLLVTVTPAESAGADAPFEAPNLAAVFAAIPFRDVLIRQLTLEVPEVGFVGAGDLSVRDQQVQFAIFGIDPEPAQLLVLRGLVSADGTIDFALAEFDPQEKDFLSVQSMLVGQQLAISATVDLSGYPLQLVRSLLLLPAGSGELKSRFETQLQLPFDDSTLEQLDLQGDFQLDWASADGALQIQELAGNGRYHAGSIQALFSAGAVQYQHDGRQARAEIMQATTLTGAGARLELGAGSRLLLQSGDLQASGVSDVLTVNLLSPRTLTGRFDLELATDGRKFNGQLALEVGLDDADQISASGNWRMAGFVLPFTLQHNMDSVAGSLRSASTLTIAAPLAATLMSGWDQDFDLSSGVLGYELELQWADAISGELLLDLQNVDVRYAQDVFPGIAGQLALQFALQDADKISATGSWQMAGFEFPLQLDHAIEAATGNLRSAATLTLRKPLAASLLKNWDQDFDLKSGKLGYELALRWSDQVSGQLQFELENVDASIGEDTVFGISGRPRLDITSAGLTLPPVKMSARSFHPGVELTDLEALVGAADDRVSVAQAAFSILGGRASLSDFSMDLDTLDTDFILTVDAVDLSQLLALEGEDIQGDGYLSGSLPVTVRAGLPSISGGRLASLEPGGSIRLAADFGALTGQPGLDFAVVALTDYRYTSLAATVDYLEDGELKLGIALQGRNPKVENGRPIHYNLNVSENVLVLLKSLRAQSDLTDGLERRVLKSQSPH